MYKETKKMNIAWLDGFLLGDGNISPNSGR